MIATKSHDDLPLCDVKYILQNLLDSNQHSKISELIADVSLRHIFLQREEILSFVLKEEQSYQALSVKTLQMIFTHNFRLFEQYLLLVVKNMLQKYPWVDYKYTKELLSKFRFYEVWFF